MKAGEKDRIDEESRRRTDTDIELTTARAEVAESVRRAESHLHCVLEQEADGMAAAQADMSK